MVIRRVVVLLMCLALAGCSHAEPKAENYDLAGLSELEGDMPPGFVPYPAKLAKLHQVYVPSVGTVVSGGRPFTVQPPDCSVLLKPVTGVAGSDSIGFRANAAEGRSIGLGAYLPVEVPSELPATGCDRMTYSVHDDEHPTAGTVERIEAPTIDGAETYALRVSVHGFPNTEYFYAAILGNRLYVNVNARLAPDYQAQPLLRDLLVKAVDAVRDE